MKDSGDFSETIKKRKTYQAPKGAYSKLTETQIKNIVANKMEKEAKVVPFSMRNSVRPKFIEAIKERQEWCYAEGHKFRLEYREDCVLFRPANGFVPRGRLDYAYLLDPSV